MKCYAYSEGSGERAHLLPGFEALVHRRPGAEGWICSEATHQRLAQTKGFRPKAEPWELDQGAWEQAGRRLFIGWSAAVAEPLPQPTRDEAQLLLFAQPQLMLEYMGRGTPDEHYLPAPREQLIILDVAGRRRRYLFRKLASHEAFQNRWKEVGGHWAEWRHWLNDKNAKVVLSFGGGGFRLFGATTVLKVIDLILEGDRRRVGEVWGSSGGALLGYVFARGFSPESLEHLGYDLYHNRHPHLANGSVASVLQTRLQDLLARAQGKAPKAEMQAWLDELDSIEPAPKRKQVAIPFYALACNPEQSGLAALADAKDIPAFCKDLIFPCDPRAAVSASTAVPFLLRAQHGITGLANDTWIDGSIIDENPLTLPYIKWVREREKDPQGTPPRLKIALVNLNLRSSESELLNSIAKVPILKRVTAIRRIAKLVDLAMDSKTDVVIRALTESPNVEVLSLKLNLGRLHFRDPAEIPASIRRGQSIHSWQVTTYRKMV